MTTAQIAASLAEYCRNGSFEAAQLELYGEEAVSIEPFESPDFAKETKGLKAILEKGHKFESMVETVHSCSASEPLVAGNSFALILQMDVTMKGGKKMDMKELCVYQVKDGKIVSEEFFM